MEIDLTQIQDRGRFSFELVGLSEYADKIIQTEDGPQLAKDFLNDPKCAAMAWPAIVGLANMEATNPNYQTARSALRNYMAQRAGIRLETN